MKFLFVLCTIVFLAACNNNDKGVYVKMPDRAIRDSVKNPLTENPKSDAIPGDMKIVKDSLITPKETPATVAGDTTTHR